MQLYTDLVLHDNINNAGQEQSAWDLVHNRLSLGHGRHHEYVYPMIEELYTLAIILVLTLVSPTIQSLSISVNTYGLWIALHGVPELPPLEELTLSYKTERCPKLPLGYSIRFRVYPRCGT